jgi:hypothetical protein
MFKTIRSGRDPELVRMSHGISASLGSADRAKLGYDEPATWGMEGGLLLAVVHGEEDPSQLDADNSRTVIRVTYDEADLREPSRRLQMFEWALPWRRRREPQDAEDVFGRGPDGEERREGDRERKYIEREYKVEIWFAQELPLNKLD